MSRTNKKLSQKALNATCWRHACTLEWTNNYESMQASGFCFSMIPVMEELYDTKEEVCENLQRHLRLYNTHPSTSAPIIGAVCALEENYQTDAADSLKIALMGPMAGIGDTIHLTFIQQLSFVLAASFANEGNWLCIPAIILPFILLWWIRFPLFKWGYKRSVSMIQDISGEGTIAKIRDFASAVGLMVVGGFAPSMVNLGIKWTYVKTINEAEQVFSIQDTLDGVFPRLLPCLAIALCYYLIKKKGMKPATVLLIIMVIGFILGAIGII